MDPLETRKLSSYARTLINQAVQSGSYTPSIAGLPVSSLVIARYVRAGGFCTVTLYWSCGTPTASEVTISIPFPIAEAARADIITLGTFSGYRNGAGISFGYPAANASGTVVKIRKTDGGWFSGTSPQAWAAGDIFGCTFTYPTV